MLIFLFSATIFSLKPLFLASGFNGSPIYGTVTKPELYPECPANMGRTFLTSPFKSNTTFLNDYPDCVAKLLRVQINSTTGEVEQLPGIITDSSPIGEYDQLLSYGSFITKAHSLGYVDNVNLFGVGYNYILHPVTSYTTVYDKLKTKIEEVYEQTHEKSVIMGHSQGTSFVSVFISNYTTPEWAQKYIDSVIFLAPAFAGWPSFQRLFTQSFSPFKNCDELKKSIMRMPGLHIMTPNHVIYGDIPIIHNWHQDYDQDNATQVVPWLHSLGKMDDESVEIYNALIKKFHQVPVPEPPVPSFILYNDGIGTNVRYIHYLRQNRIVSKVPHPGDGTVTSEGPEYACGHWKSAKCLNLHDSSSNHLGMLSKENVVNAVFDYLMADKKITEEPKTGLFIVSGFQGSPLYATVTDPEKVPTCPSNLKNFEFYSVAPSGSIYTNLREIIDDSKNFWLNDDCIAMLTRVELSPDEKSTTFAPGIHIRSSRFGDYYQLLSYSSIITRAYQEGYTHYKNFFGVGYNYMLHPLMSGEIYEELKLNIEKYYNKTGMKSVITGHSQGTSFVEIFITDFVSKEWAQKYIAGVIFYAPAFAGWGTYGRTVSGNYGSGFPMNSEMITSTVRMPGCHIMMPNEGVFGSKTVIKDFPNTGDQSNASFVGPLLVKLGRFDETAYKIFNLTNKYRKPPLPEPPVPSLVLYNSGRSNGNGYNYVASSNTVTQFSGKGDGTVSSDGPEYACSHWNNVECYDFKSTSVDHSNIQTNQITLDKTFEFINKVKSTPAPIEPEPIITKEPTETFINDPTKQISIKPSNEPTKQPSNEPTKQLSNEPSNDPTKPLSNDPTKPPSIEPSNDPTKQHSEDHSFEPTKVITNEASSDSNVNDGNSNKDDNKIFGMSTAAIIAIIAVIGVVIIAVVVGVVCFVSRKGKTDEKIVQPILNESFL